MNGFRREHGSKASPDSGHYGQDGSHLADRLLSEGYEFWGLVRRHSSPKFDNLLECGSPGQRSLSMKSHFRRSLSRTFGKIAPPGSKGAIRMDFLQRAYAFWKTRGLLALNRAAFEKLWRRGPPPSPSEESIVPNYVRDLSGEDAQSILARRLRNFLRSGRRLGFHAFNRPTVSIIIPTYNKAAMLLECVKSVRAHTAGSYEVIIVDDASRDETPRLLDRLDGLRALRNKRNSEFIVSTNRGARAARGKFLLFLNNDVIVTPGWLSHLVKTLESNPSVGAVGAKLLRPNGRLQEVGSIVWSDGSAAGYGRDDDPVKPEYCYQREADFCSAACMLVRRDVFQEIGGLDERYLPAYYEDTDLCFAIRKMGLQVVINPSVLVYHFEYASRSAAQARQLCDENRPKFVQKWKRELLNQAAYPNYLEARDRAKGRSILFFDDRIPVPHLGSGFPRTYRMLRLLRASNFRVTFVPVTNPTKVEPATTELQTLGVEVFYGQKQPEEILRERANFYDYIFISRPHNGRRLIRAANTISPKSTIVYDAESVFSLREIQRARIMGKPFSPSREARLVEEELAIMREADLVITVSSFERKLLRQKGVTKRILVWGHPQDARRSPPGFGGRKDLLFVGGFVAGHPPNTDAVRYFVRKIFPEVRKELPSCKLLVAGSEPHEDILGLSSKSVKVLGFVPDLSPLYDRCKVFVVPHRFAAGLSLKLVEAMGNGIPAVVSPVGANGIAKNGAKPFLIGRGASDFAKKVAKLYRDRPLWSRTQKSALRFVSREFASERMRKKLELIFSDGAQRGTPDTRRSRPQQGFRLRQGPTL